MGVCIEGTRGVRGVREGPAAVAEGARTPCYLFASIFFQSCTRTTLFCAGSQRHTR